MERARGSILANNHLPAVKGPDREAPLVAFIYYLDTYYVTVGKRRRDRSSTARPDDLQVEKFSMRACEIKEGRYLFGRANS